MPSITLRGERNLGEIADRLFADLSPEQRRQVETALRRANPGLREARRLTPGLVIDVPDMPELRDKARRDDAAPSVRLAKALAAALDSADDALAQALEAEQRAIKQQMETLDVLRRGTATNTAPELLQTADQTAKHLEQRDKALQVRSEQLFRAVRMIQEDLKAQAQRSD